VSQPFTATVAARGTTQGQVIAVSSDVVIQPGARVTVTLTLRLSCLGIACPGQSCSEGACITRPVGGESVDAGATPEMRSDASPESPADSTGADLPPTPDASSASDSLDILLPADGGVDHVSPPSDGGVDHVSPPPDGGVDLEPGCEAAGCSLKRTNGLTCAVDSQCESGSCVEGVCCNEACGGVCRSCLKANTGQADGTCSAVEAGAAHLGECDQESVSTCGRDGACDGAGACRRWKSGTVCGLPICGADGFTALASSTCDGAGVCKPGQQTSCGDYRCNLVTATCLGSCANSAECSATRFCDAGTCSEKLASRASCAGPDQCASGFCDLETVGFCRNRVDLECDLEHGGCIDNLVDYGPCIVDHRCR
jgi:hypothetical protein